MRQLADIPHSAGTSPVVTRASCPHVSETCLDTVNIPVPFEQRTENRELREVTTVLSVKYFFCTLLLSLLLPSLASADFRINLPKRTKPTKVQQLNRDGVKAVQKHDYDEARKFFYKAYLLDPDDPFTLNNLGYMAELDGDLDRAARFYDLAQQQNSDAMIDRADSEKVVGKTVAQVAGHA